MNADAELDWGLKQEGIFIGDHWPLFGCSFSRHGKLLFATSSLSGITKLWSINQVKMVPTSKGHKELETISAFNAYEVFVHIELLTMSHLYWGSCARNLVWDLAKRIKLRSQCFAYRVRWKIVLRHSKSSDVWPVWRFERPSLYLIEEAAIYQESKKPSWLILFLIWGF